MSLVHELIYTEDTKSKRLNISGFRALVNFLISSKINANHLEHLGELVQKFYQPKTVHAYRGTKLGLDKLPTFLKNKTFTLKQNKDRPLRSWTTNKQVAINFMMTSKPNAFGILLQDTVPSEQILVNLDDKDFIQGILDAMTEIEARLNEKYGNAWPFGRDASKKESLIAIDDLLAAIIQYSKNESEVIRWVQDKRYVMGKDVIGLAIYKKLASNPDVTEILKKADILNWDEMDASEINGAFQLEILPHGKLKFVV